VHDLNSLFVYLLPGIKITAILTVLSSILGAILSFAAGIGKLSNFWPAKIISVIYIEIFRGTSLLVQMFWLFFALPLLGLSLSPIVAGVLALGLNIGSYGAEVVRGAIQAVPKGQYEAAVALNFSKRHTLWRVVLPQALVEMMPTFGNLAIQNLKDTALVSLITIVDMTFITRRYINLTLDTVLAYSVLLVLYFVMALILSGFMRWLERFVSARVGRLGRT
jgi:polar amino acid transport system permease protein